MDAGDSLRSISVSIYPKSARGKASKDPQKILIHDTMTPGELSSCIQQLFSADLLKLAEDSVHGLYNEGGIFVPLSHCIAAAEKYEGVPLTVRPKGSEPRASKKAEPWYSDPKKAVAAVAVVIISYAVGLFQAIIAYAMEVPIVLIDVVIEAPLKHLYR